MKTQKTLSIVISAYNEEGNIFELYKQLKEVIKDLPLDWVELIFVDDGSKDKTLLHCFELQQKDEQVKIVRLIKNFGHEIAMTAGMDYAKGDAVVFMDADLQHPPVYIKEMVKRWQDGHEIVLTKRKDNLEAGFIYKFMARSFYMVLNLLSDVKIPESAPDFRLLDRKYVDFLKNFNERDSLFRGTLSLITDFEHAEVIEFVAPKRLSGESKYTFLKSIKLAMDSILQFSVRPLYLSLWLAFLSGLTALALGGYVVMERLIMRNPTPGYATIVATIGFMGSVQLFILAIIGAYVGKIHMETKKRPLYFAEFITKGGSKENKHAAKDNQCR